MMNRIRQFRQATGLTPQAMAQMFKIPYGVVMKWEKEEMQPPLWVENKIINTLMDKAKSDQARARARFRMPNVITDKTPAEVAAANAARKWQNPDFPPTENISAANGNAEQTGAIAADENHPELAATATAPSLAILPRRAGRPAMSATGRGFDPHGFGQTPVGAQGPTFTQRPKDINALLAAAKQAAENYEE